MNEPTPTTTTEPRGLTPITITAAMLKGRQDAFARQVNATLESAELAYSKAKQHLRMAKQQKRNLRYKVQDVRTGDTFRQGEVESMNDLLSLPAGYGNEDVDAVITGDLMALAVVTIRFTRNKDASFTWIGKDTVRVTSNGKYGAPGAA